ncbi:hypothetical protein IT072_02595 [Leifsonia sp. ZF2019]|uniref:hypothetical protein n=1 Tax=Leifsonia sp. ZF2019 TaxID=2781978 RepID=UPI001CC0A5A5|nr:hypothetical protein [Leifsonia sp. ZF2019]UAJ79986.1 hypothetical protein IT072_02595 [Leifsonia sp. ZF2019]
MNRANAFLILIILGGCAVVVLAVLAVLPTLVMVGSLIAGGGALLGITATELNNFIEGEEPE